VIPGEYLLGEGDIIANQGRRTVELTVANTGDRPIQVGSHFHFFEVNSALEFDREAALGMRLDVPSGQSIRFEAGDERDVDLVEFGGSRRVIGFNNRVNGSVAR
jgi:urease beta subunit